MSTWNFPAKKPLIIGHRGSSAIAPENTIAAFRQSITDGADGVEFDVHLTRDGEVVVIHDGTLGRTTDGQGNIAKKLLTELKQLDAGSWFNKIFEGEQIPTLKETLLFLKGKITIDIELKSGTNAVEAVRRTCEIIKELNMIDEVLLTSFEYRLLRQVKQIDERIPVGFLYEPSHHIKSGVAMARKINARYLILHRRNIRAKMIAEARESDILLGEYPVDTRTQFERALKNGIDIVFSNNPAYLRTLVS